MKKQKQKKQKNQKTNQKKKKKCEIFSLLIAEKSIYHS